jgi:superoxide dismutase, Cu-Zn family
MKAIILAAGALTLGLATTAIAATMSATVNMISASGVGAEIGAIEFTDTPQGLRITPNLTGLPAGPRGFHIHENASCAPGLRDGQNVAGLAAGGHYDPARTGKHMGPQHADGHRGDMPVLMVGTDGRATQAVVAPHLKTQDLAGRSVMVHAGGDNFSDQPEPLGGGGGRIACGLIK